jgi:hypothetical protein
MSEEITVDDKKVVVKELIAEFCQEALLTGELTLLNGDKIILSPEMYMDILKWIFNRIDGPPRMAIEHHNGGLVFDIEKFSSGLEPKKLENGEDMDNLG